NATLLHFPPYLDLANDGSAPASFAYGVGNSVLTFHSLYSHDDASPLLWNSSSAVSMDYFLLLLPDQAPLLGYQSVVAWLWAQLGRPRLYEGASAQQAFYN